MDQEGKICVAAAGYSCVDYYEKTDKYYPTGNGVDWGVHLSRLGIPVSVITAVGDDRFGEEMRRMLEKENIDVTHLHVKKGKTCFQKMDLKNGTDRVHLEAVEGVMSDYELTEDDKEYIKSFSYVHTDLFGNVLKDLAEFKKAGVQVILDYSIYSDDPKYNSIENFKNTDYAFLSYSKEDDYILEHIKKIHSYGPKIVTATLGENGSISYDGEKYYRCGIVQADVVNSVGPGDSYIAGFTYGIINGWDIQKCQQKGAEISAAVISKFEPY